VGIAGNVSSASSTPIVGVVDRVPAASLAYMHVPETSVHVDDLAKTGEYEIGRTWQVAMSVSRDLTATIVRNRVEADVSQPVSAGVNFPDV
jgi:hypothetical protein